MPPSLFGGNTTRINPLLYILFTHQILCQSCGHVSQREEEFLDIPVPLTGRTGLTVALKEMFNETELLEGDNKYHCGNCDCLVDARRVSQRVSWDQIPPRAALFSFLWKNEVVLGGIALHLPCYTSLSFT